MSDSTLPERLQSFFSIIELDFEVPFTERGPPEPLEEVFTRCLNQLEQEEKAEWITWGDDTTDPDRVCIMLGRKLPRRSPQRRTDAEASMAEVKAKGLPVSITPLRPFLTSEPRIWHLLSSDQNEPMIWDPIPRQERHCDIFIVEVPSSGALFKSIKADMITMKHDCDSLLPNLLCHVDRPWGDMRVVVLGEDPCDRTNGPETGPRLHTFALLIYWTDFEAMLRFKHPDRESIKCYGQEVQSCWWKEVAVDQFSKFEHAGARVVQGTFKVWHFEPRSPLIWWFPNTDVVVKPSMDKVEKGSRSRCCIM